MSSSSSPSSLLNDDIAWYVLYAVRAKYEIVDQLECLKGKLTEDSVNEHKYVIYDVYVPTEIRTLKTPKGLRKFRALVVGSYVFIKATLQDIVYLKQDTRSLKSDIRFVKLDRVAGSKNFATVQEREVNNLRLGLSQMQEEQVEFFQPTKVILEQGDKVRISGGQFEGVEGILLTQQGKSGGRLVVSVSNLLAFKTISIEPQYIQVIEFAKGSSRSYKHITKFCDYVDTLSSCQNIISPEQTEELLHYIKRYQLLHLEGKLKSRFDLAMNKAKMLITYNL